MLAACLLAAVLVPETTRWVFQKEGLSEHVSHLVLVAGIVGFVRHGALSRRTDRSPWIAWTMAAFLFVVLLEEIDWGAIYGVNEIAQTVLVGSDRPNLHNAWRGLSYNLFALPLLAFFVAPIARDRLARHAHVLPTRSDQIEFGVLAVAAPVLGLVSGSFEPVVDEMLELAMYSRVTATGLRAPPA